ncbi:type II toxin-antitoxin system VapC family toxin [Nitrospirillum amazonense]|uniref:type II toxin-antitoxin system VapC family toxin n=1 Tax=Nitrospirillum amazonense TaxID=28077 RepID=UPI0011A1640E|nr:type II toxin-antitoxin system VapC family toxin [Nitrospirillum amazonense]MDG3442202.1 type II toxin-antitoxin system VapC family toxin [Nitrospirillum amazonense]
MPAERRVYLDANIFIYLLEGTPDFQRRSLHIFDEIESCGASIYTSEITIAECLAGARKQGASRLVTRYMSLFTEPGAIELVEVSRVILFDASAIVGLTGHKLVDAIHLATAIRMGCEVLFTNDRGIQSVDDSLVILNDAAAWKYQD